MPPMTACYGLFLNQKGKVLADAWVLRRGENDFALVSFSSMAEKLRERLEAYLVADEVTISDVTPTMARVSIWGDRAAEAMKGLAGAVPEPGKWVEEEGAWIFGGRRSAGPNFEAIMPTERLETLRTQWRALGVIEADEAQAERERISSGIPAVPADIGLNDLPNEGGLDTVAISYTKGCYLGQEVMARLKNLGQIRRALHVVRGPGVVPAGGTPLFQGETKVGEIRSAAREGEGFVALAMLSLVNFKPGLELGIGVGMANITVVRNIAGT